MVKRFTGCFLSAIMLMCIIATPSAAKAAGDRVLFELKAFGIILNDDMPEEYLNESMTRAELVAIVLRMLKYDNFPDMPNNFSDVKDGEWYAPYISMGAALRILSGYEDGTFRPNDSVQYPELAKVLVSALGYSYMAETSGGYPSGYFTAAGSIGLFAGINAQGVPTRTDVYVIVHNALDIDMMTLTAGTGEYKIERGKTLRNQYTDADRTENLQKGVGVVDSNYNFSLTQPISGIKADQVQIEGRLYHIGDTGAGEYLGQEIEFYAREEKSGAHTLVSVKPTKKNTVLSLTEDDEISFQNNTLRYVDKTNDKEKNLNVSENVRYMYNGLPGQGYTDGDVRLESGIMTLIDNDGDDEIDIIFREEYSYVRARAVIDNRITFADNQTLEGLGHMLFDYDGDIKYILLNRDGEELEFESIQPNSILSVMVNEYKTLYKVFVSEAVVEGEIAEITQDGGGRVVINGTEYPVSVKARSAPALGDTVRAYLNHRGQVADFEVIEDGAQYAYILKRENIGLDLYVRALLPGTLTVEYDIDDSNPDNIIKTPYIKGRNSEVKTFKVSEDLIKRGVPLGAPVKYTLNKNGELQRAESAERVGVDGKRVYNGYDRTFGARANGAFGTDDTTRVICVPDSDVSSNDDYYAMVDINHKSEYMINGYEMNADIARLVVVRMTMQSDSTSDINDNSKMAVVSESRRIADDNGEAIKISFFSEGVKKSYEIGETAKSDAQGLKFGDVFYYTLNPLNEIGKIRKVGSFNKMPAMYNYGEYNDPMDANKTGKLMFGRISDVRNKQLVDIDNKYVDRTTLIFDNAGSQQTTIETDYRNPPSIYIVNINAGTVRAGAREDIAPAPSGGDQYAFVHVTSGTIRGIVLFEY